MRRNLDPRLATDEVVQTFRLFTAFILACGLGHALDVASYWHPIYWIVVAVNWATALVSLYTGWYLWSRRGAVSKLRHAADVEEAEEDLRQTVEVLRRSNADLERFAYVTSHDLQEPARMVGSFSALLGDKLEGTLDEDGERWLGFMREGADRMQELIAGLLQYSRVTTKGKELVPGDLGEVVREALDDFADRSDSVVLARRDGCAVAMDPVQVRRCVVNLVSNGLKFARKGVEPRVEVSVVAGDDARIVVRDNGIGIEPEFHSEVFNLFRRLNPREEYEGSGMGLTLVEQIARRHGGSVGVESEPGEGSTFTVYFPRVGA